MCSLCEMMYGGGDSSPRMWICKESKEIKGFNNIIMLVSEYSNKLGVPLEEAKEEAYCLLKLLSDPFQNGGQIYFCEDRFYVDLRAYFEDKLGKSNARKIQEDLLNDPKHLMREAAMMRGKVHNGLIKFCLWGGVILTFSYYILKLFYNE